MKSHVAIIASFTFAVTWQNSFAQNSYDQTARTYQAAVDNWSDRGSSLKSQYELCLKIKERLINRYNKAALNDCLNDWATKVNRAGTGWAPYDINLCLSDKIKRELKIEMEISEQIDVIKSTYPASFYDNNRYIQLNELLDSFESCNPDEISVLAKKKGIYVR